MCGIAGIVRFDDRSIEPQLLERVSSLMAHRGPDDRGFLVCGHDGAAWRGRDTDAAPPGRLALVHRRLAIIDLSPGGWQPMETADRRHAIVFNGEIYNYRELRDELAAEGACFVSRSDTEVLLHGLIRHGAKFLPRLIGMFAFALLDCERRCLLLARDFAGMKPLYVSQTPALFAFASEIKPLLAIRGTRPTADPARLHAFLAHGLSDLGGQTMFAGIEALPPGHYCEVFLDRPGTTGSVPFWRPDPRRVSGMDMCEGAALVRKLFLESVDMHLRSDVPVGAALSGGLDSSAIVMAMRGLLGAGAEIHTFSYIPAAGAPSEEEFSNLMAKAANTIHHRIEPSTQDLAHHLDDLVALQEEPFASTSVYAQRCVFETVRATGIVVSLDGQGADEYLGGYPAFYSAAAAALLRGARVDDALRLLRAASRQSSIGGMGVLQRLVGHFIPASLFAPARSLAGGPAFPSPLQAPWFKEREIEHALPERHGGDPLKSKLIEAFTRTSLPALLRYADRNAMRVSVESRMPFLTPALTDTVLALANDLIISPAGETKAVFRQAARGLVPSPIVERKDKIGFVTPETAWVRAIRGWVEELLDSEHTRTAPIIDRGRLLAMWRRVIEGGYPVEGLLWRVIIVLAWARRFDIDFRDNCRIV